MLKLLGSLLLHSVALAVLALVLMHFITACGQVHEGETDKTIDCIDGCSAKKKKTDNQPAVVSGPQGARGRTGPEGESIKGDQGVQGPQGPAGTDGQDGQDGISPEFDVYPVTLCPMVLGSYPEVLLCINNLLFAVYDGGPHTDRLVLIPPGSYRTTDGRICNFTVTDACNITY